mmetsp:Transcript_22766/g.23101  ORF Transcript_22766/g.23101 Transcript_22766/m.23101 type:complete len:321 (-) Transcript_22766:273-1235(-)
MHIMSDVNVNEEDVLRYISEMKNARLNAISKSEANKIRRAQVELIATYKYTKQDIEQSMKAQRKRKGISNIGAERTRVGISVQAAQEDFENAKRSLEEVQAIYDNNDMEEDIENKLQLAKDEVEEKEELLKERLLKAEEVEQADAKRKRLTDKSDRVQNWIKVNRRNAQANQKADFNAAMEQKKNKEDTESGLVEKEVDLYARRKVKPVMLWEVGNNDKENGAKNKNEAAKDAGEAAAAAVAAKAKAAMEKSNNSNKEKKKQVGTSTDHFNSNKSHQFAIDEAVLADVGTLGTKAISSVVRVRKGLSLEEYQKRKAAGTL